MNVTEDGRVKVAIADSMTLFREGLVSLINDSDSAVVIAAAGHPSELPNGTNGIDPDVLLVELKLLRSSSEQLLPARENARPRLIAILEEPFEDELIAAKDAGITRTLRRGDSSEKLFGIVVSADLDPAPALAVKRRKGLSPRECQVAELIAQGKTNREIADLLVLSEQSVKNLVSRILRKMRFSNRVQIALYANGIR